MCSLHGHRATWEKPFSSDKQNGCIGRTVFDFGKHRGKHINQVEDGYLEWIASSFSESHPWWRPAADALTKSVPRMKRQQPPKRSVHVHDLLSDLKSCTRKRDLLEGRRVHTKAVESGIDSDMYVAATLINMYAKCGSMVDARAVFDKIQGPDVVSWNALILGYADNGQGLLSLDLFSRMKDQRRCAPTSVTYIAVLKACTSLAADGGESGKKVCQEWGRKIHLEIGCHMNHLVQNTLVAMYARCGCMVEARRVFDSLQEPDVVSWTALILGYADNGQGLVALELFSRMIDGSKCAPDSLTYVAALKACASLAADGDKTGKRWCLEWGKEIHSKVGCHMDPFVQSTLIDMYSKCGSVVDARAVFDGIQEPHVVSWNALIMGYADDGQGLVALDLFSRMKAKCRCAPNSVTYIAVLKACASMAAEGDRTVKKGSLERGREVHLEIGCHMNHFVQCTLIDMYSKCGSMVEARTVFDGIDKPSVVSWNALIMGYADDGQGLVALDLFSRMKDEYGCAPNTVTYISVVKACMSLAADGDETGKKVCLERGQKIHSEIGCHMNHFVQNTLIDMYARCGSMVDARAVFDTIQGPDVVSWNTLILGYADNGEGLAALNLFSRMKDQSRCAPNSVTYVAVLKACTSLAPDGKKRCLERGREIHLEIGCHIDHFVQSTLIDMYAKCGSMADAKKVFDGINEPSVVSWNALISGYVDDGQDLVALDLVSRMEDECRGTPDSVTYTAALKACASVGALAIGRRFHSEIRDFDAHVVTCLIDFYAKCGCMEEARLVFDLHSRARDVPTWNALLAGYSSFGDTDSVFKLFETMQEQGFQANAVTFVCILSCCSHAGLLEKAQEYLELMPLRYGVKPTVRHYTCMIDLLGRANKLEKAVAVLQEMPCEPDAVTWMTLLGACHKWKNSEIGSLASKSLLELDRKDASVYILMGEIYGGNRGLWEEQERQAVREPLV